MHTELAIPSQNAVLTPGGLYNHLIDAGWQDVTQQSYSSEQIAVLSARSTKKVALDYMRRRLRWTCNKTDLIRMELSVVTAHQKNKLDELHARLKDELAYLDSKGPGYDPLAEKFCELIYWHFINSYAALVSAEVGVASLKLMSAEGNLASF